MNPTFETIGLEVASEKAFNYLAERAGDQGRRDDGEHELENHESLLRDRRRVVGVRFAADAAQKDIHFGTIVLLEERDTTHALSRSNGLALAVALHGRPLCDQAHRIPGEHAGRIGSRTVAQDDRPIVTSGVASFST